MNTPAQEHLQAIVTVLALVNPLMCGAIFTQLEGAGPRRKLLIDATKAAFVVLVILVLAALLGTRILHLFGVSLDAFSVAGGGVLAWIGFTMLRGNPTNNQQSRPDGGSKKTSLAPLILFAASPGTITGVITLAAAHNKLMLPVTALVAVGVATVIMWLAIVFMISMGGRSNSRGFVHDTMTRFMGLIVIAMGVQFALTGIRAFFEVVSTG
jgi:multiple antibiotic resistance protein